MNSADHEFFPPVDRLSPGEGVQHLCFQCLRVRRGPMLRDADVDFRTMILEDNWKSMVMPKSQILNRIAWRDSNWNWSGLLPDDWLQWPSWSQGSCLHSQCRTGHVFGTQGCLWPLISYCTYYTLSEAGPGRRERWSKGFQWERRDLHRTSFWLATCLESRRTKNCCNNWTKQKSCVKNPSTSAQWDSEAKKANKFKIGYNKLKLIFCD